MRAELIGWRWALVFALGMHEGVHAAYAFSKIADTAGPFSAFGSSPSAPSINASGTVAFLAGLDAGGEGIFTGSGGPTTTIATADGFGPSIFFGIPTVHPAINASGIVAFKGARDTGATAIYAGSGGPLTTIADSTSVAYDDFGTGPAINDMGLVAFNAVSAGVDGIFAGTGAMTTTIADSVPLSTFLDGGFGGAVAINGLGAVAFRALVAPGPIQGLYKGAGATTTPIADASLPEVSPTIPLNGPGINDSGVVVIRSSRDAGGEGIFKGSGGSLTTVATNDGPFGSFEPSGLYPAINASGLVAFRAALDAGGNGIFIGPDAVANKVVKVSDPVDGSTVTDLRFSHFGLNDAGQIAFWAMLSDGRSGIFVATPPPPGDYNFNGVVDGPDYVVWRKTHGQFGPALAADGNANGLIDNGDYTVWRSHFGESAGASATAGVPSSAVPEPTMLALWALGASLLFAPRLVRDQREGSLRNLQLL
jgi:hypothetical protein